MSAVTLTPDQDAVISEIHIAAPPDRVFAAISDPRQLVQWWGQNDKYRHTNWTGDIRPGGTWRSEGKGADGQTYEVTGEYLEVEPPTLLVYTWVASFSKHPKSFVRWELKPSAGGTHVTVRHSGFAGAPEEAKKYSGGWPTVLGWMQAFVERNETVDTRPVAVART
jgi:uncharacterized protein YndB with AHSA1/START domain